MCMRRLTDVLEWAAIRYDLRAQEWSKPLSVPKRADIRANARVAIVQKQDQQTGTLTTDA